MIRAFPFTETNKVPVYYSDFALNFDLNPVTQQLLILNNEQAVAQAMQALLLTNVGERFYHPEIGTKIQAGLFEMDDDTAAAFVQRTASSTIQSFEPRALVNSIKTTISPQDGGMYITVVYGMINITQPVTIAFLVQRPR